ncbi:MAG: hypothetical protein ACPG4U_15255, partial [Pseudomonadales bacterium]
HFPRIEVIHTLDESTCHCDHCQSKLAPMSEKFSEQIELNPALERSVEPDTVLYYIAESRIKTIDWS